MLEILVMLIIAHTFADFVFQNDRMAYGKSRHTKADVHWFHWMNSHSIINGFLVFYVTDLWFLGIIEYFLHFFIDTLKCEKITNVEHDQLLHLLTKIIYCLVI